MDIAIRVQEGINMISEEVKLNLTTISKQLLELEDQLQGLIPTMIDLENKYTGQKHDFLLHSMLGNAPAREAEAFLKLQQEPIFREYHDVKFEVRKLWSRKETLIEISKNLRAIETNVK